MKNKLKYFILIISLLVFPKIVLAADKVSCGNVTAIPKKIPELTSFFVTTAQVATAVILVILGSIDLFKGIASSKEEEIKKGQKTFVKRLIVAALVFFVTLIVKVLIGAIANSTTTNNIVGCMDCFLSNSCGNDASGTQTATVKKSNISQDAKKFLAGQKLSELFSKIFVASSNNSNKKNTNSSTSSNSTSSQSVNISSSTVTVGSKKYKVYCQGNYSSNYGSIPSAGCSVSSMAIVLTGYGKNVTPTDVASKNHAVTLGLEQIASGLKAYGLSATASSTYVANSSTKSTALSKIDANLKKGKPVIILVRANYSNKYTGGAHYMALLGYKNNKPVIADPAHGGKVWNEDDLSTLVNKYIYTGSSYEEGYVLVNS